MRKTSVIAIMLSIALSIALVVPARTGVTGSDGTSIVFTNVQIESCYGGDMTCISPTADRDAMNDLVFDLLALQLVQHAIADLEQAKAQAETPR